ncbi:hypothetical protein ACFE04_025683 [Oxalis oulophora]
MCCFVFVLFLSVFTLFSNQCYSAETILVDGVSVWKNPTVHVGDIVKFKHKYDYKVYIFKNQNAFNLCNFTQATLLTKPNSTSYTWYPSRPGFFYFTFNNGSLKSCQDTQMLAIQVFPTALPPVKSPPMEAPPPVSGGFVGSTPVFPWPSQPRQGVAVSPSMPPGSPIAPVGSSTLVPDKGGDGAIPFINSNPAVPLPTGEVDSTTIKSLPISYQPKQAAAAIYVLFKKAVFDFQIANSRAIPNSQNQIALWKH